MIDDPIGGHNRSLIAGVVVTILVLGCAVALSLFSPIGSVGNSKILQSKDSGALYALINGTLHPVSNLASARLSTGSSESPHSVADSVLDSYRRGPAIGIPLAPSDLSVHSDSTSEWTVCDNVSDLSNQRSALSVAVIVGTPRISEHIDTIGSGEALLVRNGNKHYLIHDGVRAQINVGSFPVRQAFGLHGVIPRTISAATLNAIPVSSPITAPVIRGFGKAARWSLSGAHVGSVIRVDGASDTRLYVVLLSGIQEISPVVGDMIRAGDPAGGASIAEVAPGALAAIPQVHELNLAGYPASKPVMITDALRAVLCFAWSRTSEGKTFTSVTVGDNYPIADPKAMIDVVGADRSGYAADAVYVTPGAGYFVRTTGSDPGSVRSDGQFYISDIGVRYGMSADAPAVLGFGEPMVAPYEMVSLIPAGPTLSKDAALIARNNVVPGAGAPAG